VEDSSPDESDRTTLGNILSLNFVPLSPFYWLVAITIIGRSPALTSLSPSPRAKRELRTMRCVSEE
jgi:hypothetical protein